jgi:protein-S-isoprenylcysteine O-methyltransferase Ste14
MGLEEGHLRERFGTEYEKYAGRTARLIPYVF